MDHRGYRRIEWDNRIKGLSQQRCPGLSWNTLVFHREVHQNCTTKFAPYPPRLNFKLILSAASALQSPGGLVRSREMISGRWGKKVEAEATLWTASEGRLPSHVYMSTCLHVYMGETDHWPVAIQP